MKRVSQYVLDELRADPLASVIVRKHVYPGLGRMTRRIVRAVDNPRPLGCGDVRFYGPVSEKRFCEYRLSAFVARIGHAF
jgi:hypothetical protein